MLFATVIFAILLDIVVGERNSLSRAHEYPETQIYTDSRQIDGLPLVYARCNPSEALLKIERQCVVTMRINAFEKSVGETKECTVNLKSELRYGVINDRFRVYAFGRDKALLVWTEAQSFSDSDDDTERSILKTTVVHVFDGCRTYEANVRKDMWHPLKYFNSQYMSVITFNNTFEMRLGTLEEKCKSDWFCDVVDYRLHKFDDQARRISEVEHWPMPPFDGRYQDSSTEAMNLDQPDKGYFVVNENDTSLLVELINKTTSGYHQLRMWKNSDSSISFPIFHWSLANEAIGFCYKYANASYGCWKSDQAGHIHAQMNFTLDVSHRTHLSAVYNLQNDRLLLAVPSCSMSNCYRSGRSKYYQNYHLMEVDETSNINTVEVQFETKCFDEDNNVYIKLFENKQGQYCIVRLCQSLKARRLVKGRSESSVRCYSSDEFSKCTKCL